MPLTLKGLVFGGDKKEETEYKHKNKLNKKTTAYNIQPRFLQYNVMCRFSSQINNQMEIKLRNDGKQKAQSCEAEIELSSKNHAWGHFRAEFSGYGANDWSAKMNLIQQVDDLIVELQKLKDSVS